MTPDERDLVTDLFNRLKSADTGARDRDVEALIADLVSRHPGAAYVLAQTVLVQEQALKGASERIAELEKQAPARDAPSGGFLASAPRLGPWGDRRVEPAARPDAEPARSPFSYQPRGGVAAAPGVGPQAAAGGGGGSFLRSALGTAAGVAGGALLFESVRGMLGHNAGPFGSAMAAQPGAAPAAPAHPTAGTGDTADRHSPGDQRDVAQDDRYADDDDDDQAGDDQDDGDDQAGGDFGSDDDNV